MNVYEALSPVKAVEKKNNALMAKINRKANKPNNNIDNMMAAAAASGRHAELDNAENEDIEEEEEEETDPKSFVTLGFDREEKREEK